MPHPQEVSQNSVSQANTYNKEFELERGEREKNNKHHLE